MTLLADFRPPNGNNAAIGGSARQQRRNQAAGLCDVVVGWGSVVCRVVAGLVAAKPRNIVTNRSGGRNNVAIGMGGRRETGGRVFPTSGSCQSYLAFHTFV